MAEKMRAPITAGQYSLIRALLGGYLVVHFLHLLPYGAEVFSAEGILPTELSPLLNIIPNPLAIYDSPTAVTVLLIIGTACGLLVTFGAFDQVGSIVAALILGWLYARNPLIANPSLPVVGWLLIANVFLPRGAYGSWPSRGHPERWLSWFYPMPIWFAAWILLAVAYTYSGYTKLLSPAWIDGSAIRLVLENPLAREHFLRDFLLFLPPIFLQLLTWLTLVVELLFLPLCVFPSTRKWAWIIMLFIQFGFLTFLNFADLTFPMLLIHALTFDRRWIAKYQPANTATLFFDGTCAFCSGLVRFALSEDMDHRLHFAPLQGNAFTETGIEPIADDSIVVYSSDGEVFHKSDAAINCLEHLGGIWLILGKTIRLIPRTFRDRCYDLVGKVRYRLAGKVDVNSCQLLPPEYSARVLA